MKAQTCMVTYIHKTGLTFFYVSLQIVLRNTTVLRMSRYIEGRSCK